jgi:hypothetical protein
MSTDYQFHFDNFESSLNMLRELKELLSVTFYLYFGMPDYSRANRGRVLALQYSADDINACVWLNIVSVVITGKYIRNVYMICFSDLHPATKHCQLVK